MFVKKSQAEIDAMAPDVAEKYFAEKEAHEQSETQKKLDAMADALKSEFKGDLEKANAALKEANNRIDELKETAAGKAAIEKGTFVEFVEKSIESNSLKDRDSQPKAGYGEKLVLKAAAFMTTANVVPNVTGGYSTVFGSYVEQGIAHKPKNRTVFRELVTVRTQPGTENIYYTDRINEEGTAAFIAEGATKPLADAEWKTASLSTKEVAIRWKMTTRLMYHAPAVIEDMKQHATELVDQVVDIAILTGDGTGTNLNGIVAEAGAFVVPAALAGYYADANIYDVISAMATQIRIANFDATDVVLHPVWAAQMAGIKDNEGRYLIPPFVSADGMNIMGIRVHYSNNVPAANILIGDLKKYVLVVSEDAIYNEGYENDDFSKNLVSKKIESFMQGFLQPSYDGAILYDAIADVIGDIEAA